MPVPTEEVVFMAMKFQSEKATLEAKVKDLEAKAKDLEAKAKYLEQKLVYKEGLLKESVNMNTDFLKAHMRQEAKIQELSSANERLRERLRLLLPSVKWAK